MKRFQLLVTIALLLSGLNLKAYAEEEYTKPLFGIKAAVDLNLPGKWHGDGGSVKWFRHGFGGTLGGVCNVYLGRGFYLEPGVSLFYDTYSYYGFVIPDGAGNHIESDPSIYKLGLRVPVVFGYEINAGERFAMTVFTGPELSYAFAGNTRLKHKNLIDDHHLLDLFGKHGYQRRVDCAWKVGIGFPADAWYISLDAAFGLTNLLKSDMTFRENRLTLGVTRYF